MKSDSRIPQWDLIQIIVEESHKIKTIWRLKKIGYKFVFAPDFSEINAYIAPYRDFSEGNFKQTLNQWYAIKLMLENIENTNILIPPYHIELIQILSVLRKRGKSYVTILEPIKILLNDPDFIVGLINLKKTIELAQGNNPDVVLDIMEQQGAKIGLLYELMSIHTEIDLLQKLWDCQLIKKSDDYFPDIDDVSIVKNSLYWESRILKIREEKSGISDSKFQRSHLDGWAVEYIRTANLLAKKKPENTHFIIFVSRSTDIYKAVKAELDIRIPNVGLFQPLWTPETYLAYHIIGTSPNTDYEGLLKTIDDLYQFCQYYKTHDEKPSLDMLDKILMTNELGESIQNLLAFQSTIIDQDLFRFIDATKLHSYQSKDTNQLITKTIDFFATQDIGSIIDSTTKKIDDLWHEFGQGFPIIKIAHINFEPHVTIKFPGYRVWIKFKSKDIIDWIHTVNPLISMEQFENYKFIFQEKGVSTNELLLLETLICMFKEDWVGLNHLLGILVNVDDEYIRNEAFLISLSVDYLNNKNIYNKILSPTELLEIANKQDARTLKMISIMMWKEWERIHDNKILLQGYEYAQKAYDLMEYETEFMVECQNNLAYYQMLLIEEMNDLAPSVMQVNDTFEEMTKICEQIYRDTPIPVEIHHTLGRLQIFLALNNPKLTQKNKYDLLSSGSDDLFIALRGDRTNTIYLRDYDNARRILDEISINRDKHY